MKVNKTATISIKVSDDVKGFKLYEVTGNGDVEITNPDFKYNWTNEKAYNNKLTTNKSYTAYVRVGVPGTKTYHLVAVNDAGQECNPIVIKIEVVQ